MGLGNDIDFEEIATKETKKVAPDRFRSKPTEPIYVTAMQWTGDNAEDILNFIGRDRAKIDEKSDDLYLGIGIKDEFPVFVGKSDWIMKRDGRDLPTYIDAKTFEERYEKVCDEGTEGEIK